MADITLKAYIAHLDDLLARRSYEEAEAHAKHILSRFPRNLQVLIRLGKAQIEAGHYNDAEHTFTRVLAMDPRSVDAYVGLSWVARQRGDGERAIALLERAFEHDPTNQDVIQLLIDANRNFRDKHNPKLPQTAYMIARQQWRSGLAHQALATIKTALDAAPGRVDLELLRAQIYQSSGSAVDAARSATEVVKKMPDCIEANRMLAEFWKHQGRPSDAQKFISRVESADPFMAYEIASGGPPPDGTFTLPLYDFRAISNKASTAAQPDWLGAIAEVTKAEDSAREPEPPADWLESASSVLEQNASDELGWVADAVGMPDDLNWLDQAANASLEFDFDEQPAAPEMAADAPQSAARGAGAELLSGQAPGEAEEFDLDWMTAGEDAAQHEPAADADLGLSWTEAPDESTVDNFPAWSTAQDVSPEVDQWIEDQAADEGDTLPSMSTMKAEQERANSEMAAVQPEPVPAAEDWLDMSAIDAEAEAEPIENFDEFLKNFTAFGDMETDEPRPDLSSQRTGLTGLLSSLDSDEQQSVAPEVADIDPEDPLAWMRSGTVDHEVYASAGASEDDMPGLEELLSPPDEFEVLADDVAREFVEPEAGPAAAAEAVDDEEVDPLAWMREYDDIELVEDGEPSGRRWTDAFDVEHGVELDAAEADPLAWMREAGVTIEGQAEDDAEADPLAWAKEDGLELVDEVVEVTHKPTEALIDPGEPRDPPQYTGEPTPTSTGMTGLLAFIKADGENVEGDSLMSDLETPRDEPESESSDAQPEAPQAKEEFDWMAAAPVDSEADDIDWDAAPAPGEDDDAAIPDWLAAVSNPVDAAEAAALSAVDDPNVPDLWDPATDEIEGDDMPDWMAALKDESPQPEPQAADEAGDWLFSEAEPSAEASENVEPLPIQPEAAAGDDVPDRPAEVGDAVSELADWIGAAGMSSGTSGEDRPQAATATDELPDWMSEGAAPEAGSGLGEDDFLNFLDTADERAAGVTGKAGEQADESLDWFTSAADDASEANRDVAAAADEALDWLESAGDDQPAADAVGSETSLDSEIPDWLEAAGEGASADESPDAVDEALDWLDKDDESADSVPVPQEPDWFSEVDTGRMAAEPAEDTPDWLKDMVAADDRPSEAASDDMSWLDDSQNVIGDVTNAQPDHEDAGGPSYELSHIEGEESTEAVETLELEPEPDVEFVAPVSSVVDVDVPASQLEVQKELSGEILDDADLLEPEPPVDETLTPAAANSPDWLNAMVPGLEVNVDAQEAADDESGEFLSGGKSDFSWLTAIVEEELAPPKVAAPSRRVSRFPFDEPPVWLRVLRDETQTSTPVATAENDDDALPDWLRFDDDAQTN